MDQSVSPQRFKYSCTECQRRKQKCNRIFPCVHCKNRGAQRNCNFKEKPSKPANPPPQASGAATSRIAAGVGASKKRCRGSSDDSNSDNDSDADTGNGELDSVGQNGVAVNSDNTGPLVPEQSSSGQLTQLSPGTQMRQPRPRRNRQYYMSPAACPELRTALAILPEDRNHVARYLYSAMPTGHYHKNNVLWFLHSTYWYKAEAMFAEACHMFYTAVREAQELGFDTEQDTNDVPNFELEIRRRAWCVIDSWDWQIASGLSRDTLVNHSKCNAKRPSLTLETDGDFSPLMHMNMQSDLVHKLAGRFPCPAQIKTRSDVMEYKGMIDEWMRNFPPIFALTNPDTSNDKKQAWIEYHRHYNYTMGYMMVLNPFRPHMALPYTDESSVEELELRRVAVDLTLVLVQVLDNWLKFLTFRDGRFHFIIFSLVDAATVMSNMVLNDKAQTLPRRDDVYRAIKTTLVLQRKLYFLSDSAKLGFRIVQRIVRHLFRSTPTEYLASLENGGHDGASNDSAQPITSPAPEQAAGGALMNIQYIDPDAPVGPSLWDLLAAEFPALASDAGTGSQRVPYTESGTASRNSGATAISDEHAGNMNLHMIANGQAITSFQDTLALPATFPLAEPTVSTTNAEPAPMDYPSSASLPSASSAPPSYVTALTPESSAGAAAHVESMSPEHASVSSPAYVTAVSPGVVAAPSLGPITSAYPGYIATTPVYFGPVPAGQVPDAPLSNVVDASLPLGSVINTSLPLDNIGGVPLNGALGYSAFYNAGASPTYNAAMPAYIDPAFFATRSPSESSEFILAASASNIGPIPGLTPTSFPPMIPNTTFHDTSTPHLPWPGYNNAGLYTTPNYNEPSVGYGITAPLNAPSTYATPALYSSPESRESTEHSLTLPEGYGAPSSVLLPTTNSASNIYTSPSEGYASPENHGALGDYTSPSALLCMDEEDYNAHTVSTVYETPESYHTAPTNATPEDNSGSPNVQPPV